MGERKPFVVYVAGGCNIAAGLVGLALCVFVPAPNHVAGALCKRLDEALDEARSRIAEEERQLAFDLEIAESEARKELIQGRIDRLKGFNFPPPQTSLKRLRSGRVARVYALVRVAALLVAVVLFVSGFALLLTEARWARYLAIAVGAAAVAVVLAGSVANASTLRSAAGEDLGALLASTRVPGYRLDPDGVLRAVAEALVFLVSLLLCVAAVQYPIFLLIVCFTPEVADAFFA